MPLPLPLPRFLAASAPLFLASVLLAGCNKAPSIAPVSVPVSTATDTQVEDAVITFGVKSALLAEPDVNGLDLQVSTRAGLVQLSGYVDSQAQIDKALVAARGVAGVNRVENSVTLKGSDSSLGTKLDDATVTGRVKAALLADPAIRSFDISVLTFKGEVQLTGFVDSPVQIEQAEGIARAIEGAVDVKNELKTAQ
jgi:hyperosmotically inducible protein